VSAVGGNGHADARNDQPVRLAGGVLGDHRKNNFAVVQILQAFLARNHLALRRKDGRDAHQVLRGNARIAQGQLKRVNRSLCLPTPLVKKSFFGTMLFPNFYVTLREFISSCPVGTERRKISSEVHNSSNFFCRIAFKDS
jgi:hypothetical protein